MASASSLIRALALTALAGGVAYADHTAPEPVSRRPPVSQTTAGRRAPSARPWTGFVEVARPVPTSSAASSRLVYLNRCAAGCVISSGGTDDSRTDTSSIVSPGDHIVPSFSHPTIWNDVVACVKTTFAPFDITITDVDPGNVPHFENVVAGKPSDLNPEFAGAGGVAPFSCGLEIPNAIVYTFDVYGPDVNHLCWTSAQEIAHAFGLEHQFLQKDPLTYLDGDLPKRFRDVEAQCGEYEVSPCRCAGSTQNTYRHIVAMFGPGAPTAPEVSFKRPVEGREVQPGFKAVVNAEDDVRIEKVELYADGALVATATMPIADQFELTPTEPLAMGAHTLEARAYDVQGITASAMLEVTQGPPCKRDGCEGNDVCVMGVCVPGPEEPGGLGSICQADTECLSHRCADGGQGLKHCVESCVQTNASSCPVDFVCISAGTDGVCWPDPDSGCCSAGSGPAGPMLLGLGVFALVLRRRRR